MADVANILVILLIASLIQGVAGFGFGLFAMGVLTLMMPITDAAVIVAIVSLGTTLVNVWTLRDDLRWREVWPILTTALPATALGVYLLQVIDPAILRTSMAVVIVFGCVVALWSPGKALLHRAFPWAQIAGSLGGLLSGVMNMGGPPVVLYTLFRDWDKSITKGVMSAYFLASLSFRMVMLAVTGATTPDNVRRGLLVLLPALAASYLGVRIFRRMSTAVFRYATTALLVGLAIRMVVS
ncbi:MAG TPA: sulfite exporter TauE/SafE family protein [Chloroflexi bacterium]|nr:sulfite exporter TauE/SafE family protein [Chloroflexota bacterium]